VRADAQVAVARPFHRHCGRELRIYALPVEIFLMRMEDARPYPVDPGAFRPEAVLHVPVQPLGARLIVAAENAETRIESVALLRPVRVHDGVSAAAVEPPIGLPARNRIAGTRTCVG